MSGVREPSKQREKTELSPRAKPAEESATHGPPADETPLPSAKEPLTEFGPRTRPSDPTVRSQAGTPVATNLTATEERKLGDYILVEEIARGGMGIVYRARQVSLNRIVAVKMMLTGCFAGEREIRRFLLEAESAGKLNHPNIVPIYEAGSYEGRHYFSMSFVEGKSLAQILREGPLHTRRAAEFTRAIANAVQYAHDHGVIHRDLKPGNILIDRDDNPKVTDFGLAKFMDEQLDNPMTATGSVMGTPGFMAPEQAAGRTHDIGPESDVYSLGAVMYAMLTTRAPFHCPSQIETLRKVCEEPPPSPAQLNPEIDRDLETICLRCLEKDPKRRFSTARDLADELDRYLQGEPITSRRIGIFERWRRWCNRRPAAVFATCFALILAIVSYLVIRSFQHSTETKKQQFEKLIAQMEASTAKTLLEKDEKEAQSKGKSQQPSSLGKDRPNDDPSERFRDDDFDQRRGKGPKRGPPRHPDDPRDGPRGEKGGRRGPPDGRPPKDRGGPMDPEEARDRMGELNDAVAREPENPRPRMDRARSHEALGDIKNAIADYTKVTTLDPKNDNAQVRLAWLLISDNTEKGIRDYPRGLKLAKSAYESAQRVTLLHIETLVYAYVRNNQIEEAKSVVRDSQHTAPEFDQRRLSELLLELESVK